MNKETEKVIKVVDDALKSYGTNVVSVDRDLIDGKMIHVNICTAHSSDAYMLNVAHYEKCDMPALIKELDKRHVGYCI